MFADEADPTAATWSNLSHPGNPLKSPGMFVGQSPSTTSYEDNVFFLGGLFDFEGTGMDNDSIMRTRWDFRIGFLEDPDEFVGVRQANDESWDLWAGAQHNPAGWGSDGVSLQFNAGASDDDNASPIGSDEQYIRASNRGILLQSGGAPATTLAHEGNRDAHPLGVQTTALTGFDAGGQLAENAWARTGVAYNDKLSVSFWMEQTEPGGDVTFFANAGDVLYQQSFDPGSPDDPKIPNPTNDPNNPFTDGYFDWQNATPVIFVGAIGGTVGATGIMGFQNPIVGTDCDFDGSGSCDIGDLNELLYTGLGSGDAKYDLDNSGSVDLGDRDALLVEIGALPGDADLNGLVNAADLNSLGSNWQARVSSWADGDFNGDSVADVADLNEMGLWWTKTAADFAASEAPAPLAATVPEPVGYVMLLASFAGLLVARR